MAAKVEGIVVGYDGSEGSGVALDWAAETARREGRPLTILHTLDMSAVPPVRAVEPTIDMSEVGAMESGALEGGVARARKILGEDADIRPVAAFGSAAGELIEASRAAELIVTGSRGRGRLRGGLLGSVAYSVTAHAACPAVVVRTHEGAAVLHPGPDHPVVVSIDESGPAARALDEAARVAHSSGARLHVVSVTPASPHELRPGVSKKRTEEARRLVEESLDSARARVGEKYPELVVDTEVLYGDAGGQMVADFGSDAGLIVVGSRGRGGFVGMLLGSFSHSVIHHAACPTMVVR